MKKTFLLLLMAITTLSFVSCEKEEESIATPSGFQIEQVDNTLVLTWNTVSNATKYVISKNGSYWQSTSKTTITDTNPVNGTNSYELVASNGNVSSKPAKASFDFKPQKDPQDPEDPNDPQDPQDTQDPEGPQEIADYYIKHPWGTGTDDAWSWQPMTKIGNNYTYSGAWGGVGANINTTASDNGAEWFPASKITGASSLTLGSTVTFVYNPTSSSLLIEGASDQPTNTCYYIKHPWGSGADNAWIWQSMVKNGSMYEYDGLWGGKGANINTKPDDDGATYYNLSNLNYSIGARVHFVYNPSSLTLSVALSEDGGTIHHGRPATPTGVQVGYNGSVSLSWNPVQYAEGYKVYRKTFDQSNLVVEQEKAVMTTTLPDKPNYDAHPSNSFTDIGANRPGYTYQYTVTAINHSGESDPSVPVSVTIPKTPEVFAPTPSPAKR